MAGAILFVLKFGALLARYVVGRIVYNIIYNLFISPLKAFPGPLLYRISSLPLDIISIKGVAHHKLRELHDKYGPIVRIRPYELSYITSAPWKDVYGFRPGHEEFFKAERLICPGQVLGILDAPRDDHRRYRRLLAHAFSAQGLRPVNVVDWLSWVTADIIGDLTFGEPFGSLDTAMEHEWTGFAANILKPATVILILKSWGVLDALWLLIPKSAMKAGEDHKKWIAERVQRRVNLGKERGDFLDYVLKRGLVVDSATAGGQKQQPVGDEKGIRLEELNENAYQLVLGGSETTATVLSGTIFYLLRKPDILRHVTAEVRTKFPDSTDITIDSLTPSSAPYLDAVLQEGLRLYHPTPLYGARLVPAEGDIVDGVFLPEGTKISLRLYVAFTSSVNFARPREFVPERWLAVGDDHNEEQTGGKGRENKRCGEFAHDNPDGVFQPFSAGPRNCIGMNLANAEMRLIMASLLWHFDLGKPRDMGKEEAERWEEWVERQKVWFLWHKGPLMMDVKTRGDRL
ncbi:cytochrome P450 [Pseudomassariella vexata]|uniref:Cytochrome P450 n=1 Tax=Pseudomassariella vexata TaxID=1141098 RepID=A0A1Y2E7K1_9PEZI|nr:cytochrome P450 [Pseudomassariella vexata]ORY67304.1 cytochrome P450 [Pseudomassariella vexata]